MTDRIKVNAMDNDETKWPSWTAQGATTYAEAGVDTAEGARAVDAIKDAVHRTYRDEVRGDIGGFRRLVLHQRGEEHGRSDFGFRHRRRWHQDPAG